MPPSSARRYSPGRELRVESHKRGRSLEGGLVFRDKDDDLMLFKEMQTRERDNFLLQSDDDFECSFSTKLGHFSDFKLGIAIPGKAQNSELLNVEEEKNDYDWLLTPPDTPLFQSLDDETLSVTVSRRGRPRSQPISISRSSMMEKNHRSSRGSASPSRSSKSPQSSSSVSQSRGRPSSARQASPTPSQRHANRPSRASPPNRDSPPPSKPSTPGPRSSTPASRRMSSGPGAALGSLVKGTSPVKSCGESSALPKIQPWQANLPGFSTDAPPNLRISVVDHPASNVRGTSPASRHSQDSSSNMGGWSMSPTGSRCIASSSQDRDKLSSHSKGSVGSSGDDDVDTLQSVYVGSLDRSTLRKVGASPGKNPFSTSKKRVVSLTSAPKRSFDSALRQMDHRKSPQNMFRPHLSSVPSRTFYAGNSGSMQHLIISGNSSVTTSSSTSCDHGISMALDMEERTECHGGLASETVKEKYSGMDPEIFEFDNENMKSERNTENRLVDLQLDELSKEPMLESGQGDAKGYVHSSMIVEMTATSEAFCGTVDHQGILDVDNLVACSICGCMYDVSGYSEREGEICPECHRKGKTLNIAFSDSRHVLSELTAARSVGISEENVHLDKLKSLTDLTESQRFSHADEQIVFPEESCKQQVSFSSENCLMDAAKNQLAKEKEISPGVSGSEQLNAMSKNLMLSQLNEFAKADASETTGISVLLTRSSSIKGPVIQGRTVALAAIPRDDLSYARDNTSSMRSSYGRDSVSGSSSVDYTSRQTDHLGHSQLHGLKLSIDGQNFDIRSQSMGSSFSGTSENAQHGFGAFSSVLGDFENSIDNGEDNAMKGTVPSLVQVHLMGSSFSGTSENAQHVFGAFSCALGDFENSIANGEDNAMKGKVPSLVQVPHMDSNSSNKMVSGAVTQSLEYAARKESDDDVAVHGGLGDSDIHEEASSQVGQIIEPLNHLDSSVSDKGDASSKHRALSKCTRLSVSDTERNASVPELSSSDPSRDVLEESTVMVETRAGSKARSLMLEEATDTILFCSSIVHDLAYKAATIAIEKEDEVPLGGSHPTVTILGKSTADSNDPPRRGRIVSKRALKTKKTRPKQVETEKKTPTFQAENDENIDESLTRNIGLPSMLDTEKPPKLESKCNCTIM